MRSRNSDLPLTLVGTFLMVLAGMGILGSLVYLAIVLVKPPATGEAVHRFAMPLVCLAVGIGAGWVSLVIRRRLKRAEAERRVHETADGSSAR